MKKVLAASLTLAFLLLGAAPATALLPVRHYWRGCHRLYTVRMAERAALRIYAGTRDVPHSALHHLGWYERCQRTRAGHVRATTFDRAQARLWRARRLPVAAPIAISSGWSIPAAIVRCESGGRDLPPNGAGASGYYQIIPSTWAHFDGYAAAYLAPKWVQDQKAAYIWRYQGGPEQWVCKA